MRYRMEFSEEQQIWHYAQINDTNTEENTNDFFTVFDDFEAKTTFEAIVFQLFVEKTNKETYTKEDILNCKNEFLEFSKSLKHWGFEITKMNKNKTTAEKLTENKTTAEKLTEKVLHFFGEPSDWDDFEWGNGTSGAKQARSIIHWAKKLKKELEDQKK